MIGTEVLIVGAGITGLTTARELVLRGFENIVIIDKESRTGMHASGRNSGVLHAGIYYSPDSFKARFCVEGNRMLTDYCRDKGLPLENRGKVIVVTDEGRLPNLYELRDRALGAGARCSVVDEKELGEIEPHAITHEKALYSPDTSVIDPKLVLQSIVEDLECTGCVRFMFGCSFMGLKARRVARTTEGEIEFDWFVNAAGTFADRVAGSFRVGREYRVLPIKGTYKELNQARSYLVKGNIYPVPDLENPFLGVHFTRGVDGRVFAGPTAMPAYGREEYRWLEDLSVESLSILSRQCVLFLSNGAFRRSAAGELKKYLSRFFYDEASTMIRDLRPTDLVPSDKVGIRPQLVNWSQKSLVMDFVLIKDANSVHILNAISPAFTSSMSFAKYSVDLLVGEKRAD